MNTLVNLIGSLCEDAVWVVRIAVGVALGIWVAQQMGVV